MAGWDIEVLCVTDNSSVGAELATRRESWSVETVGSVAAATAASVPAEFDCLLTKYDLPDGDGIELLEWVRATDPDLPVVLYATDGSETLASEAISAGVTDYLQEPVVTERHDLLATRIEDAVEQYRTREELTASRRQLSLFVEQSPLGVIEWDRDGEAVRINDAAQEILGYDRDDLLGNHWETIVADEDVPAVHDQLAAPSPEGTGLRQVNRTVRRDGEQIVCEWHNQVVTDDDGNVLGSYSQFQEITDRQFRREAITNLHDIVDDLAACSSRQAVLEQTVDAAGQILDFDRAAVAVENDGLLEVQAMSNNLSLDDHPTLSVEEGVVGRTYRHQEAILVDDVTGHEGARPQSSDMAAAISVPVGESGVLQAVETEPDAFDEQDLELAKLLAQHAETALDRLAREREVERIYEQVEFALEATDSMIWAVDIEARELRTRIGPVERLFGMPSEEFADIETALDNGVHPDDIDRIRAETEGVLQGEQTEFSVTFRTDPGDGEPRWLESLGSLQDDNRMIGLTTDVTDRERRERELRDQNERLEQFTDVVSHDLRNPLTVAENYLELAREEHDSEHLDSVAQAHERMDVLLEQLLGLARNGNEALETEPVTIDACVRRCWQNVDTGAATLTVDAEGVLVADRSRLQQLLENLVRNAVEHGPEGVSVTVGRLDDGFYVADDGSGIPSEDREAIFDSGFSTDDDGTGFGLKIVTEVVEAHSWEISVTDSAPGGARFEVTGVEFQDWAAAFGND